MPVPASQTEPPAQAPDSIWPWILATLFAGALLLALAERLPGIERSLLVQSETALAEASARGVEVTVDGRDVDLTGELDPGVEREAIVAAIGAIEGVRVVRDALEVIDPDERLRDARRRFQAELAIIDTSALVFEPGSTTLASGADATIDTLARLLSAAPDFRVRIAGHTDNTGRAEINVRLSRERAEAVVSRLAARGIDPARMIAKGYGATQPLADNASASGRAENRRIEISYID